MKQHQPPPVPPPATMLLRDTSPASRGITLVASHPAVHLPATEWPDHAFEVQHACGISWNWEDIIRFLSFVTRDNNCLIWNGAKSRGQGNHQWYGSFWCRGKTVRAHKFAAVAILGLRPETGQEIDHGCDGTRCVSCLSVLTREQNQAKIRRPKKRHLDAARAAGITPAEVMCLSDDQLSSLEILLNLKTSLDGPCLLLGAMDPGSLPDALVSQIKGVRH